MTRATATTAADLAVCRPILAHGSRSFAAAARLLPARVRGPATVFYAFCRLADDAVDESEDPTMAVQELSARLDAIHAGAAELGAVDAAFARVVAHHAIPRPLLDALVEGFLWDARGRAYPELCDLLDYCARVASAVGAVMTLLMGVRSPVALARACDMGAAMQLTNIARDVGEDLRGGRLYLPRRWLEAEQLDPEALLAAPTFTPALGRVVARLLEQAERLYVRADAGVGLLPADCRGAIRAARRIYAEIGREVARAGHDSVGRRAVVGGARKLWLGLGAWSDRRVPTEGLDDPPEAQFRFLVDAVGQARR
jgi:phytoene synthase